MIDFLITAAAIFVLIKLVNSLHEAVEDLIEEDEPEPEPAPEQSRSQNQNLNPEPEPEPEPTTEEKLLAVLEKLSAQLDKP